MDNMDMNEQSFVPESQSKQGQHSQDEQPIDYPAQPYYWSTKPDAPKDEPASLYDDPMVQSDTPHDYQRGYSMHNSTNAGYNYGDAVESSTHTAQPSATYGQQSQSQSRSRYQQQQYSPDGDAFEQQYHYRSSGNTNNYWQWSVPAWARPQRHRHSAARWFWFILLALLFIGPLTQLLGFLLVVGAILLALLFPFIVVALFSIPFMLSRALLGRPSTPRRWRYTRSWRMNNIPWRW
jgi:hypothetical protein